MGKARAVALLLAVTMLFRGSQNMAQTTLSILARERLDLVPGVIGVLTAASALAGVAATVLLAPRVHAQRRAAAVMAALGILTASLVCFATARSLLQLTLAALLLGVGGGLAMPTLATMAGSGDGTNRDRDLALYTVALSLSLAVGPLVEALVLRVSNQSLLATFLAFACFPALGVGLLEARGSRAPRPAERPPQPVARGAGYRALLGNRSWRLALTGTLLYQVPFAAVVTFGGAMAREAAHASPAQAEVAFGAFFALSLATRAWLVWRAPIVHKLGLLRLGAALTAAGLVLLALANSMGSFVAAMAILGLPHGLIFPVALGLIAEGTESHELARANAGLLAAANVVNVAVPSLLGAIADLSGYRAMALTVLVPVAGFAALLVAPAGRSGAARTP